MVCIQGLTTFSITLFKQSATLVDFNKYIPFERYHAAIAGILKQGVERLDNVRQQAGDCLKILLKSALPEVKDAESWQIRGLDMLKKLFLRCFIQSFSLLYTS
jgi:tubulin-specific chaperone D